MTVLIGTSGWQYNHWRERFYPKEVPQRSWLEFYVERFQTVESNNAFYQLPKPETFAGWAKRTPEDFVMAVKMSRYLTHIKRLKEPDEPVQRFIDHASNLGAKLGPVLVQLPPTLRADLGVLDAALDRFPSSVRVAVEFRHDSWFTTDTRELLERRNAALCMADRHSKPISPLWRTTDWTYLRFHEGAATPHPCYGRTSLRTWAERLAREWGDSDIYVYFNNDPRGCALRDARIFSAECARSGLDATRVPSETVSTD